MFDGTLGRLSRGLTAGAALSSTLLLAGRLRAQELGPILLSYRAPANCPEVADFQHSVERRSSHIHFVDEGSHDRELSIVLSKDGDFTTGELRLIERDGGLRQRSVRFTTCAEAVEGLALITAVSLDPQALLQAEPAAAPAPKPVPPKPKSPPVAAWSPPPVARPSVAASPGLEFGFGGALSGVFQALPALAPGGTLFLDFGSGSQSWFAPLLRGAVSHWERRSLSEPAGNANFALTLGTLSVCPVRLGGSTVVFRPCAFASGGVLHAWGSSALDTHAHIREAWSWGGSALLLVKVAQALDIVGDVALGVPLIRERFAIDQAPFWTTPPLYLSSSVGLRFVFR